MCTLKDLNNKKLLSFNCNGKKILLANLNGNIYATDLICTHAHADLSNGILNADGVMCPLHLSVFDLSTGKPINPPAEKQLVTYNIKIDGNVVYVDIKN